ncbi:hypothetical protein P7C71_g115, partial [Lecanoromycetidae sp. Uapishka_2]
MSATTIEVPLFLQPIAYDPTTAPPIPERPQSPVLNDQSPVHSPPEPSRVPPPPPRKIPLDYPDGPSSPMALHQRPRYDPQSSYDGSQRRSPLKSRRPKFDPQNSHDVADSAHRLPDQEDQPTLPPQEFTSFNVESALPTLQPRDEPAISPGQTPLSSKPMASGRERDLYHEHLHQSSVAPIAPTDVDRWTPGPKPWQHAAQTHSPEHEHATLVPHDERSISTTDLSSNTAGKSTPESHQTSNTSYRESEHQVDEPRDSQEGDGSFYWHSGRSSSDAEDNQIHGSSPTATPGEGSSATTSTIQPREHQDLPLRSTSLSPVISAPYGASALGFGGPSDWEYFGDYEAEEIDDEELYSRSRPRDSTGMKDGSTQLPADPAPVNGMSEYNEAVPNSRTMTPVHEGFPRRQAEVDASHDSITQETNTPTNREHRIDETPPVVQSHDDDQGAISEPVAPPNTSPEHRLDMDEVIRAWSEAPYAGLVEDKAETSLSYHESSLEPPDVAEASLASTPRERMLGVDVLLRSAPSVPRLPVSLDQLHAHDDQRGYDNETARSAVEPTLTPKGSGEQLLPNSGQQISSVDTDTVENAQVPSQTISHPDLTRSGTIPQYNERSAANETALSNTVDDGLLGLGISNHQLNETSMAINDDPPTTAQHNTMTSKPIMPTAKPVKNSSVLQRVKELEKKRSEASFHARSKELIPEDKARDSPRTTQINTPETSRVSTPHHEVQEPLEEVKLKEVESTVSGTPKEGSHEDMAEPSAASTAGGTTTKESVPKDMVEPSAASTAGGSTLNAPSEVPDAFNQNSSAIDRHEAVRDFEQHETFETPESAMRQTIEEAVQSEHGLISSPEHLHHGLETSHADTTSDVSQPKADSTPGLSLPILPTSSPVVQAPNQESSAKADKATDPYADLDAWGKASLNRFAAMLREESRAETNKDKLNLFNVFTSRESRLRVILYGTEDDLIIPSKATEDRITVDSATGTGGVAKPSVERTNTVNLQRSLKALPALPANRESVVGPPENGLAPLVIEHASESKTEDGIFSRPAGDDSLIMTESPSDGPRYSSGGRPRMAHLTGQDQHASPPNPIENPGMVKSSSSAADEVAEPDKPIYAHAKPYEGRSEVKNYLANRKSVIRPYATLTQGSLESGSTFGKNSGSKLSSIPHVSIVAPTSQYNLNLQQKGEDVLDVSVKPKAQATEGPADMRRFVKADFDPLLTVLPDSAVVVQESPRLEDLRNLIEAIPDDFSFIHQSVVSWDAKAKKQREEHDRQRHARQVESEQRIDSLFDDHEIGYGDISELEAEFKQSEAARRADEDRAEYQTFVVDVFNIVWTRLHYELDQLIPHYEQYSKLMNHTLAGKDMFEDSKDSLPLAPTMSAFLGLHQKLEIRHQKAFEAVLERDRRLKKTEMAPWYTLSNITKVKQLEKQFEDSEKKAIIDYCQQRDTRANRLMDVLDQNTLRGVGANQDYMEAIMKAVRRIASGRAFASVAVMNEPIAGMEEVEKAKSITTILATSSEQIVQTFHVADMLLNSADYEVSVAKAKVAKADTATLAKLREERAKEDQKLMRDLEHRLALIREDSRRTNDEIVKLMLFLGVQNGRAQSTPQQAGPTDADHEARIQKALEEAKIRNALKES